MKNFEEFSDDEILISRILACEANQEDENNFRERWNSSKTFQSLYFEWKEIWDTSNALPQIQNLNTEKALDKFIARINKAEETPKKLVNKIRLIVSSVAATILIAFLIWAAFLRNRSIEIVAVNNVLQNYVLPDKSIVDINKGSKLVYKKNFGTKNREVYLSGEAYFRVKKNKSCPFIVNTDITCVKVTGTAFNVNCTKQNVIVSVDTGSVLFSAKNKPVKQISINAGQAACMSVNDLKISGIKRKNINYNSWLTRVIKFDHTSLSEAATVLEKYYSTKIIFQDKSIENFNITATFNDKSLDSVLKILELTFGLHITKNDSIVIINSNENIH